MTNLTANRRLIEKNIIFDAVEQDLQQDNTIRTTCPFCEGLAPTFTITRTELGLLYNCYRASCGEKGFISSIPGTTEVEKEKKNNKKFVARPFTKPLESLPENVYEWFQEKYEISPEECDRNGFKYEPKYDRIYMPVFDYADREFGGITKARSPSPDAPKTLTYFTEQTSGLHYVRGARERTGPIALSEDIFSGIKLAHYCRSVCLLGTTINPVRISELMRQTDTLILVLDPDAVDKALKYKKKYSLYFSRNFYVVLLSNDPKDTPHAELEQIMMGYINGAETSIRNSS